MRVASILFSILFVAGVAIGLTWVFWWPLWSGAGLIGGDIYPYYFPQKAWLADNLAEGVIPLWNPLVGFGYPTLGESQTGVLYPPNLFFYSQNDLNSAYNYSQLFHYVLAFVGMWACLRELGVSTYAAIFAATAFVYGWFPARICLEWAIIGGAWFAVSMWAACRYLQTRQRWALSCLACSLGMGLLAGHYHLMFITLLVIPCLPLLIVPSKKQTEIEKPATSQQQLLTRLLFACGVGFCIAAVQLLPSWELKSLSQRQSGSDLFAPTYGHLPPLAISQLWQPWTWHADETLVDEKLSQSDWLAVPNATNQVEAFVYCGLLTVALVVLGGFMPSLRKLSPVGSYSRWLLLAIGGLLLATGWPTHFLSWLPGLGFFRGAGRYSMITVFALSVIAGGMLDAIIHRLYLKRSTAITFCLVLTVVLVTDVWSVSRQYQFETEPAFGRTVFYSIIIDEPPITLREEKSELREYFAALEEPIRLHAPMPNVPTMLGVSAVPVYLGLGPEIYETDPLQIDFNQISGDEVLGVRGRLIELGVTHLLLEEEIDPAVWQVEYIGPQIDQLLKGALGRREPLYLYRLNDSPGRVSVSGSSEEKILIEIELHQVSVQVPKPSEGERVTVTSRDLNYPGWIATVDGQQLPIVDELTSPFRKVEFDWPLSKETVEVRWEYRPWSIRIGAGLSILGLLIVVWIPFANNKQTRSHNS